MAVDVAHVCLTANDANQTPTLSLILSSVFAAYVLIDSLLAAAVIVRKTRSTEKSV